MVGLRDPGLVISPIVFIPLLSPIIDAINSTATNEHVCLKALSLVGTVRIICFLSHLQLRRKIFRVEKDN